MTYSKETLESIYSLALMYFELGYFSASEKLFSGINAVLKREDSSLVDESVSIEFKSAVKFSLTVLRLDQGEVEESIPELENLLSEATSIKPRIKIALVFSNILLSDFTKAKEWLMQIEDEEIELEEPDIKKIYNALSIRLS